MATHFKRISALFSNLSYKTDNFFTFVTLHKCRLEYVMDKHYKCRLEDVTGLKVNDLELVAYATRFLAVHLKNYVWSHHHTLKAKVQSDLSIFFSHLTIGHTNKLLQVTKFDVNLNIDITQPGTKINNVAPLSFHLLCVLFVIFKPNLPVDSLTSNFHFFPHCYGGHKARRS